MKIQITTHFHRSGKHNGLWEASCADAVGEAVIAWGNTRDGAARRVQAEVLRNVAKRLAADELTEVDRALIAFLFDPCLGRAA